MLPLPPSPPSIHVHERDDRIDLRFPAFSSVARWGAPAVALLAGTFCAMPFGSARDVVLFLALGVAPALLVFRILSRPTVIRIDARGFTLERPLRRTRFLLWDQVEHIAFQAAIVGRFEADIEKPAAVRVTTKRRPLTPGEAVLLARGLDETALRWLQGALLLAWGHSAERSRTSP